MSKDFGWDLVYQAHRQDFKCEDDAIVAFIHWRILFESDLRCVGLGENFNSANEGDANLTEVLPRGWSQTTDGNYCIRYRAQSKPTEKFLLKIVHVDDLIVATLVRISDEKVTTVTIKPQKEIGSDFSVKDKEELRKKIDSSLLEEMFTKSAASAEVSRPATSEQSHRDRPDPLRIEPTRPQPQFGHDPLRVFPPPLGGSDLDPLGRIGQGGMIVDPRSMGGGRGRGGLPQFDPVNPFVPNPMGRGRGRGGGRYYGDELPPPDFDNMFG